MAKQLVVSGNKILARGEDCFISTSGGSVLCTVTGDVFENATVATYDCQCPVDLEAREYTFEHGEFIPPPLPMWKTLADVTLTDDVTAAVVSLRSNLYEHTEARVLIGIPYESTVDGNVLVYVGENVNGAFAGELSVSSQKSGDIEFKELRINTIYRMRGEGTVVIPNGSATSGPTFGVPLKNTANTLYIKTKSSSDKMYTGYRIIVIAR